MKNLILIIFFVPVTIFAQKLIYKPTVATNLMEVPSGGYLVNGIIIDGDTFPLVKMSPIIIFPQRVFKSNAERRRYDRLTYNLKVVYPYAILIGIYYKQLDFELKSISDKAEQKKFIKMKEKELKDKYAEELMDLTFTQGKLLFKLIDRQTNHNTYEVIQQFKGTLNAAFWQTMGIVFGYNLKVEYQPDEEDKMIEEIVAKIENGQI